MPWQNLYENKFPPLALQLIDSTDIREAAVREHSTFPSILPLLGWFISTRSRGRKVISAGDPTFRS